jgi:hypothetical protein
MAVWIQNLYCLYLVWHWQLLTEIVWKIYKLYNFVEETLPFDEEYWIIAANYEFSVLHGQGIGFLIAWMSKISTRKPCMTGSLINYIEKQVWKSFTVSDIQFVCSIVCFLLQNNVLLEKFLFHFICNNGPKYFVCFLDKT